MKKYLAIALLILIPTVAFAADKQPAFSDLTRRVYYLAPYDVVTISANTSISEAITAIRPATDVYIYFGTDTANEHLIEAGETFPIHHDADPKLKTETSCLIF